MPDNYSTQLQTEITVEAVPYTDKEIKARSLQIDELNSAYDQQNTTYTELDDMTYPQWYVENKKAASGYVRPRSNPHEVRTNSGVVRAKCLSLLSQLLEYKFEPDVEAYDENNQPDKELGELSEDLIRRSRELEDYNNKRVLYYKELADQGNVFVWERFIEQAAVVKKIQNMDVTNLSKLKWKESVETINRQCVGEMVTGLNVYLGNIREYDIQKQPFVGLSFERTRSEAQAVFGEWERWKYVPYKIQRITSEQGSRPYEDWSMVEVKQNMVNEIHYMNVKQNTYQIYLNGVAMLPVGFPLQYIAGGQIRYPISKGNGEPISPNFAYCRSIPSKNKFNQQMMDEFLRAMILKTRWSYNPGLANSTGKKLTQKIFYPALIHEGIQPDKIKPIFETTGVTAPEFNMMTYLKGVIDEDSVASIWQGQEGSNRTATESQILTKQTMMKLGVALLGVTNFEKDMCWNRLYDIFQNWTDPIDTELQPMKDGLLQYVNKYRTETVESQLEDGRTGKRVIEFSENLPEASQIKAEEELLTDLRGEPIRKMYVNPVGLKNIKHKFYIEIVPSEKQTSELRKAMFEETGIKMIKMFPETTNKEFIQKQMAINADLDPDKVIIKQEQIQQPPMGQPPTGQQANDQSLLAQMQPKMQQPSVNSLVNSA